MRNMAVVNNLAERRALMELSREEIQDKHLRLMEENMMLKKHARSQEDKMKRMATKLLKLTADERGDRNRGRPGHRLRADEDKLSEMEGRVLELERKNESLASKNLVLKHQLESKSKRHTPYDHVRSRISSGVQMPTPKKKTVTESTTTAVSVRPRVMTCEAATQCDVELPSSQSASTMPTCHNLLDRVRQDNQALEAEVVRLKSEMIDLAAENVTNKEKLRLTSKQLEEEKLVVRHEMQEQITKLQSEKTDQEVEMLKVQRQIRDSASRLQNLRTKHSAVEKNLDVVKISNSKMLDELERLNKELKEERARVVQLEVQLRSHDSDRQNISSLEEVVVDLKRERDVLREANRDLNDKVELSGVRHKAKVRSLQEQLHVAEEASNTASNDRLKAQKLLTAEREVSRELDEELRKTRDMYHKLREEFNSLQGRLKFFDKETSLDWSEVEEALALMRAKKEQGEDATDHISLEKREHEEELQEMRAWHADTVNELEKTRKLLQMQHTINKDYKSEVESLKAQLEEVEARHHDNLKEQARMMDIKTARATELENRLKDIAYGTHQYQLEGKKKEDMGGQEVEEEGGGAGVVLEHGQNLLQFGVSQVVLSSMALSAMSCANPAVFLTISYCDYEVQVTPVLQGPRPNFGFTANYVVTVDDTFMQHLQKGCLRLELNQAMGLKYQPLGFCQIKCHNIIGASGGKYCGRGHLTGMAPLMNQCVDVGSVEYWMKLKIPITHSAKLYQDRSKAQTLMGSLQAPPLSSPAPITLSHGPDYNQLTVTLLQCQGLTVQDPIHFPSPYVIYKFYSFPDHDTAIVANSVSPQFMDVRQFPVSMDSNLHQYLTSESLELYVFDDDEQEGEEQLPGYMGVAQVSLHDLSLGKNISGTFQLKQSSGEPGGVIEVAMKWKLPYVLHDYSPPPEQPHIMAIPTSSSTPHHIGHTHSTKTPLPQETPPTTSQPLPPPQHTPSSQLTESPLPSTHQISSALNIPSRAASKSHDSSQTNSASQAVSHQAGLSHTAGQQGSGFPPSNTHSSSSSSNVHKSVNRKHTGSTKPPAAPSPTLVKPINPASDDGEELSFRLKNSLPPLHKVLPATDHVSSIGRDTRTSTSNQIASSKLMKGNSENTSDYSADDFEQVSSAESVLTEGSSPSSIRMGPQSSRESAVMKKDHSSGLTNGSSSGKTRSKTQVAVASSSAQKLVRSVKNEVPKSMSSVDSYKSLKSEKQLSSVSDVTAVGNAGLGSRVSTLSGLTGLSDVSSSDGDAGGDTGVVMSSTPMLVKPASSRTHRELSSISAIPVDQQSKLEATGGSGSGEEDEDNNSICSVSEMSKTRHLDREETVGGASKVEEEEEEEEEIEEELEEVTDEDTMFEETLREYDDNNSGLSEHSSELVVPSKFSAPSDQESEEDQAAAVRIDKTTRTAARGGGGGQIDRDDGEREGFSSDGTLSGSEKGAEDGNPITDLQSNKKPAQSYQSCNKLVVSIHSFTKYSSSALIDDPSIESVFVECEFLDFDTAQLETKSVTKPSGRGKVEFHFRKELVLSSGQLTRLAGSLASGDLEDARLSFTLVSDPGDEGNCEELGVATYNLHEVLQNGKDIYNKNIEVVGLDEDSEVVGFITVSIEAYELLASLNIRT